MKMLYDVIAGLPDGSVEEVRFGNHWTAVVASVDGRLKCGLASNPAYAAPDTPDRRAELAAMARNRPARQFCDLAFQPDMSQVSVGIAAINALLPLHPESWVESNAGEVLARRGAGKRVALVGHFPFVPELRAQVGRLDVLELRPQPGDRGAEEAVEVIPQADVVAITSMTLINGTLDGLVGLCSPGAYVVLLGPSTPLCPVLFDYGVDMLCGAVVEKLGPVLQAIDEGKHFRQIERLGVRLVTIAHNGGDGW